MPGWEPLWIIADALPSATDQFRPSITVAGGDLAFLQYTSGSTAAPRGVMVTHDNLMCNSQMIKDFFRDTPDSVGVNWLPPYHDMGLVGAILQPLYVGFPSVLMSPITFLQRPIRWLQAISHYQGTTCGGPNFAFEWCARRVNREHCAELDLSSWTCAFVGAEPNRLSTFQHFCESFGQYGFRWESLLPVYGLAEASLFVSGVSRQSGPVVESFDARSLTEGRVRRVAATDTGARSLVSAGSLHPNLRMEVVQPKSLQRCPPDQIGEIWLSGPSVATGYWNLPEVTNRTFGALLEGEDGRFLRTGDLGFMFDGELFVAGRLKDVIVIAGLNRHPDDIEATVEASHTAVRPAGVAAFSVQEDNEERLIILAEIERRGTAVQLAESTPEAIERVIRRAVAEEHEVNPFRVVLLKTGSIPKTSSGKIQRHACRTRYLTGSLDAWRP